MASTGICMHVARLGRRASFARYAGVHLIAELPFSSPHTDIPDVRVKIVRKYRYKIFYMIDDEGVKILHIRHMSRQPWE